MEHVVSAFKCKLIMVPCTSDPGNNGFSIEPQAQAKKSKQFTCAEDSQLNFQAHFGAPVKTCCQHCKLVFTDFT